MMKVIRKKTIKKADENPNYKQFKNMIKIMNLLFGKGWNDAYDKIVSDLSLSELEEMSKLTGGSKSDKLIRAAKSFILFMQKWNDSEEQENSEE